MLLKPNQSGFLVIVLQLCMNRRKTWQNNFYTRDIYLINANADANSIVGMAALLRVANVQNVNVQNVKIKM